MPVENVRRISSTSAKAEARTGAVRCSRARNHNDGFSGAREAMEFLRSAASRTFFCGRGRVKVLPGSEKDMMEMLGDGGWKSRVPFREVGKGDCVEEAKR